MVRVKLRFAIVGPALLAMVLASATVSAAAVQGAASGQGPKYGGTVTTATGSATIYDPGTIGYAQGSNGIVDQISGGLLLPPENPKNPFIADLATSYSYNKTDTTLKIELRHGVKFSDGSAFNAKAVIWNFDRYAGPTSDIPQYFSTMTSVVAKGNWAVVVHFSSPDAVFVADIGATAAGLMMSPTAFSSEGTNQFALQPVGAGPYKIALEVPGQQYNLVKNPLYWDAKHVYIANWDVINAGTNATAVFDDLESDAIQLDGLSATNTPAPLLYQAASNHVFASTFTPALSLTFMPINTYKPPFNNVMAREALDYCMDRAQIATNIQAGFAQPIYVWNGTAGDFLPSGGTAAIQKLMPYPFNPAKGTQIVQSLGGLSFQILEGGGQAQTIMTAIAQQWTQNCGINATVVTTSAENALIESGSYQAAFASGDGFANPALITSYFLPSNPFDVYGFNDPIVTNGINSASTTTDTAALKKIWSKVWLEENTDAVDLPVIAGGTYELYSKCLKGLTFNFGPQFTHAYLVCKP